MFWTNRELETTEELPLQCGFAPRVVTDRGVRILRLDFRGLRDEQLLAALETAARHIRAQPPSSLRILTLLTPNLAAATEEAFRAFGAANAPYALAGAVVTQGLGPSVSAVLTVRGRGEVPLFGDEASALEYLVAS